MTGHPWTPDHHAYAVAARSKRVALADIAHDLGRSRASVGCHLRRSGTYPPAWSERAVNAEPWEPLAGMVKRCCTQCAYWFATPADAPAKRCPDCELAAFHPGRGNRQHANAAP